MTTALTQYEDTDDGPEPAYVVITVERDGGHLTPEQARTLAAELAWLADLAEDGGR